MARRAVELERIRHQLIQEAVEQRYLHGEDQLDADRQIKCRSASSASSKRASMVVDAFDSDRRLPRGHRVVGGPAARLPPPGMTRAGAGRSATARWGFGARCARCSRTPASSAAGSTRSRMFLPRCRSRHARARRRRSPRSGYTEDRRHALDAVKKFEDGLRREVSEGGRQDRRRPRARCSAFYDYPAEHWIHLRTTNPIDSRPSPRFETGSKITKGPGWRADGNRHGLQADPVRAVRAVTLPRRGRTTPGRAGPCRREIRQRRTRRTPG